MRKFNAFYNFLVSWCVYRNILVIIYTHSAVGLHRSFCLQTSSASVPRSLFVSSTLPAFYARNTTTLAYVASLQASEWQPREMNQHLVS